MEKDNVVSIWFGNLKSERALFEFVQEKYDEDGVFIPSPFMETFGTGKYDADFQEVMFEENLSKEDLLDVSYAETFINKIDNISGNSVILLYDFCYTGQVCEASNFRFIGTFDYAKTD